MTDKSPPTCVPVDISDDDIYDAMKSIPGYLDITPGDFKELYIQAYQHAARRLARAVKASDVMTRDVAAVKESTPLAEVAALMTAKRVSGVPVVSADGRVVGVISEKDFLRELGGREARSFMEVVAQCLSGGQCLAAPVVEKVASDIMTTPAVTVCEDTPVLDIADRFTNGGINRAPVVDGAGKLVGIVSRADVVRSSLLLEG
jgi:CBS domain-containing membrane protein